MDSETNGSQQESQGQQEVTGGNAPDRFLRDFCVTPSFAASTAASSASSRYAIGLFGTGGAFTAFAAWLSVTRAASSDAQ